MYFCQCYLWLCCVCMSRGQSITIKCIYGPGICLHSKFECYNFNTEAKEQKWERTINLEQKNLKQLNLQCVSSTERPWCHCLFSWINAGTCKGIISATRKIRHCLIFSFFFYFIFVSHVQTWQCLVVISNINDQWEQGMCYVTSWSFFYWDKV